MIGYGDNTQKDVSRINKMHPYKMISTQELIKDDFDRRTYLPLHFTGTLSVAIAAIGLGKIFNG